MIRIEDRDEAIARIKSNINRIENGHEIRKIWPPVYFAAVEFDLLDMIPEEYIPTAEDFPAAFENI